MSEPIPTHIKLLQKSRQLSIHFDDGQSFELTCEYCRVFSPSAEVQGHGGQEMKIVPGKKAVNITAIEPVGNYGVKLIFNDGHNSGIFTWETLYKLGKNYQENWAYYLTRLQAENLSRETEA